MTAPAWMPLYVADYLADTGHLSTLEHGAYLLLIMHYWQNGGLPDDDTKLARIARLAPKDWGTIRDTIAELFACDWQHKRIDAELAKASENLGRRSAAGKAGASARYSNRIANAGQSQGNRIANAGQSHSNPPSPSPSSLRSESSKAKASGAGAPPDDPLKALWDRGTAALGGGARSLIGKARREYGDIGVLNAIARCEAEKPSNPVEFFLGALRGGGKKSYPDGIIPMHPGAGG